MPPPEALTVREFASLWSAFIQPIPKTINGHLRDLALALRAEAARLPRSSIHRVQTIAPDI